MAPITENRRVGVAMCGDCQEVHFVCEDGAGNLLFSFSLNDSNWDFLFRSYYTMKNKRDKEAGIKPNA